MSQFVASSSDDSEVANGSTEELEVAGAELEVAGAEPVKKVRV